MRFQLNSKSSSSLLPPFHTLHRRCRCRCGCEQSGKQCAANWRKEELLGRSCVGRSGRRSSSSLSSATSETLLPAVFGGRGGSRQRLRELGPGLIPTRAPHLLLLLKRKNQLQNFECVCSAQEIAAAVQRNRSIATRVGRGEDCGLGCQCWHYQKCQHCLLDWF